jgi:RNA polymerase sigma-70 factor (ECF subfamily)
MDREAFERVVHEQKDRVYSYASMMLRGSAEAQDVAQEALVRLWQHRSTVENGAAHFWLRRTVHNLCIDRLRRDKTRAEADLEPDRTAGPEETTGPQRLAESGELGRMIRKALGRLPARDRAVLILREVQGLPYAEIAEILELPLGTLKARLHRAREQLRKRLIRAGVTT